MLLLYLEVLLVKKGILKIMLGSVILEAILVCIFILIGSFDDVTWKSLESVGIIFGYSIPCLFMTMKSISI